MRNKDKKNQRKEAILDAFQTLIGRYGVDKTTMQEIADSVGISVGTLYNEFADKEALIDALVNRLEASLNKKITALKFTSDAPDEQLVQLLKKVFDLVEDLIRDNRSLADYMLGGSQKFRYVGKKIHEDYHEGGLIGDKIRSIMQSGVDQGVFEVNDLAATALAISQAFTTYALARLLMDPKQDKAAHKSWMIWFRLLIRGLLKRP
ncbi:MAG: TetR/AcrR family transcriptional regulator [candidate division Zixibacteria bacterium]|nr:TetR/AcrR family transcriptional regulator [candidate division Zixibacteria bacterium]